MFGGVVDPEAGLGREPIDLTEPIDGGFEAWIVEDFGFTVSVARGDVDAALPVVAVPLPFAVVAIAPGHEAEADGFVAEFENELRNGGVGDAELFPVRAVFAVGTAKISEQTMAQAADGEVWLREPGLEQFVAGCVAHEVGGVAEEHDAGCAGEEFRVGELHLGAVGELQIMREREVFSFGSEVGHEFGHLTAENEGAGRIAQFEAIGIAPAGEPFEKGGAGDDDGVTRLAGFAVKVSDPLNAIPIDGGEKFLFVRGAGAEVEEFGDGALFFTGAGAIDVEFHLEVMEGTAFGTWFRGANDAEGSARSVEVKLLRGEQPFLELSDEFFLLLGGFDFGEALEVGVRHQLAGERTVVFEEKKGGLFQARFASDRKHARPPGGAREIFAGEGELLEVIFEEEEGALRIGAVGEDVQEIGTFGDGGLGVRELAAQIGEGAVSFIQNIMMCIILRGLCIPRRSFTTTRFRHLGSLCSPCESD